MIKKNGQVMVCIDSQNLNLATSEDEHVIPIANMLIEAASSHGILMFVDGKLEYN